ncbi:MAG: DNA (cytosine-5-)-methyltransferase [Clostridia bacterium]|nr:DNA (cytosine-5-)-methyltransferase [Clostridia bacterium]MBR1653712.1 DNA (cytosine-5-)-methyltransferase [Clostridia bacterium]
MQESIFDMLYHKYKITKPIRLIEFFAGYGSQALALKYLGVPFEHWKICEWAVKSIQAYKDIHFTDKYYWESIEDCTIPNEILVDTLFNVGISSNYNEPMTKEQIQRLSYEQLVRIYENILITNNLVNIQGTKGKDLEIVDTDKYDYILTYSFPCQDLSLAGKGKGMSDTSTRSGMLWEVERILYECKELGTLPQILLMENVPQVHGTDNVKDFNKWQLRLEELGYKNYFEDLIATDYGIPQTRNRCFMVSILGDYSYTFPKPIPLEKKLKDMLEDNVDEKYYISDKQIKDIQNWNAYEKPLENMEKIDKSNISPTLTTRTGAYAAGMVLIKNNTKKGYLEAKDGDGVDISSRMEYHRGTVQKGKTQTLTTMGGENNGVVVSDILKKDLCNKLIQDGLVEEGDVVKHSYTQQILDGNKKCVEKNDGNMITLTTRGDCVGTAVKDNMNNLRIRKLTPKECFRLMGVKDENFEKCAKNQSNASLYHLAGDSIVVNVLMAIFNELLKKEGE